MNCKDDLLLLKAYRSIYIESSQSNMVDDITNAITKAMNEHGFFGNSSILKEISNKHRTVSGLDFNNKSSLEYRKWKSETSRQVNNNSNQKYLSGVTGLPFDLNRAVVSFQFFPEKTGVFKNNYDLGGFFNPEQDYITFVVNIAASISDESEFIKELKPVIVHEFIHVRQVYEAKLKNRLITIPKLSIGGGDKSLELMEKEFKEYLMHDTELEAYAVEYNFRHNNNYNRNAIMEFARGVFEKNLGSLTHKDNTTRQALTSLFERYVEALSDYINRYPYTAN